MSLSKKNRNESNKYSKGKSSYPKEVDNHAQKQKLETIQKEIIRREKQLLSLETRSSKEKLEQLLSTEFQEIGSNGTLSNFSETSDALQQEKDWSAEIGSFSFNLINENIAQLIYKARIKHKRNDQGTLSLRSSLWRREEKEWKIIFHQGTKIEKHVII